MGGGSSPASLLEQNAGEEWSHQLAQGERWWRDGALAGHKPLRLGIFPEFLPDQRVRV